MGRLYETTIGSAVRRYLYDGDTLVAEYSGTNTLVRRYGHGDQVDEPWVEYGTNLVGANYRTFLFADHQGSIIARSNGSGSTVTRLTYDQFGIPGSANTGRFGYTGQIWFQELGLFHYKAKMYSPKLGRFLQTDPIGYADNMNMYAYVGNDPVNKNDSTGEFAHIAIGAFAGGLISGIAYAVTTDNFSAKDLAINVASGAAVGAVTAAVPGAIAAGSLNFGGKVANAAVSGGNAVAAGAAGSVATQAATTGNVDAGQALVAGAANAAGLGAGNALAKPAAAAATVKTAGNPGLPVTSLNGNTFMVGKVNPTSVTSEGVQQAIQDIAGETASAVINEVAPCVANGDGC